MAGKQQKVEGILAELGVEELYDFLGASPQSTQKELTSCYRKKALKYHPDKNPDNPNAADLFQKLSKTYNILTDPAAKAAYDKWLKAKHAAALRNKELSTKRRKMKESLESRETRHQANIEAEVDALKQMQREVERLREEGYQLARQQEELLRQELLTKAEGPRNTAAGEPEAAIPTLKVTWKCKKKDASSNGGYSQELLENIFSKFGALDNVVVSRKGGKALVVFRDSSDAATAKDRAQGLPDNPLVITWIGGGDSQAPPTTTTSTSSFSSFTSTTLPCSVGDSATPPAPPTPSSSGAVSERDYESLTLMRMRQAEERKRLNQQLAAQDSDE